MNEQHKRPLRQLDGHAHDMLPLHPKCWEDQTVFVDGRMTHRAREMFGHDPDPQHTLVRELFTTIYGTRWRNGLPQTVHIHLPLPLPQNQNHEDMRSVSSSESSEEEVVD